MDGAINLDCIHLAAVYDVTNNLEIVKLITDYRTSEPNAKG